MQISKEEVRAAMKVKKSVNAIDPDDISVVVWSWREGSGLLDHSVEHSPEE